jgi:hypothetical protein
MKNGEYDPGVPGKRPEYQKIPEFQYNDRDPKVG